MSRQIRCPECDHAIDVPNSGVATLSCTNCAKTFSIRRSASGWVNLWGAAGLVLTVVSLLAAQGVHLRFFTIALSGVAALVPLGSLVATRRPQFKDHAWTVSGTALGLAVCATALFAPGLLNHYWEMNAAVPAGDPNHIVIVPRDLPHDNGRPLAQDAADPTKEALRQEDVLLRIDSITIRELADQPGKERLLIYLRFGSSGHTQILTFHGFADVRKPTLKDASGRSYGFIEQRPRKLGAGPPFVFISTTPRKVTVSPGRFYDSLLVFESPPGGFSALTLELPTAAWDRTGIARFSLTGPFEARLPEEPK